MRNINAERGKQRILKHLILLSYMLEAIGFDFDDTIIRTEELVKRTIAKVILERFGKRILIKNMRKKLTREELERQIEQRISTLEGLHLPNLLNSYNINYEPQEIKEVYTSINNRIARLYEEAKESTLFKGIRRFLEHLYEIRKIREEKGKKLIVFIASHADMEWVRIILENLGLRKYFNEFCTIHPKQYGIRRILERHKINPEKVLFIGDSIDDYLAAKNLRMRFIGVKKSNESVKPKTLDRLARTVINDYRSMQDKIKPLDPKISLQIRKRILRERQARKRKLV